MFAKTICSTAIAIIVIGAEVGFRAFADDPKTANPEIGGVPLATWESLAIEGDPDSSVSVPVDALGLFERIEMARQDKKSRCQLRIGDSTLEVQLDAVANGANLKSPSPVHVTGRLASVPVDGTHPDLKHLICIATQIVAVAPVSQSDWTSISIGFSIPIRAKGTYERSESPGPPAGLPHRVRATDVVLEIDPVALPAPSQRLLLGTSLTTGTPVDVQGELCSEPFDASQPNRKRLVCLATQLKVLTPAMGPGTDVSTTVQGPKISPAGIPDRQKVTAVPAPDQSKRDRALEQLINTGRGMRAWLRSDAAPEDIARVLQIFRKAGYKVDDQIPGLIFTDLPQGQKADPQLITALQSISREGRVFPKAAAGTAPWVQIPYGERPSRVEKGDSHGAAVQPPKPDLRTQSVERPSLVEKGSH